MNRITRAIVAVLAALALVVGVPLSASAAKPAPPEPVTYGYDSYLGEDHGETRVYLTEDHSTYVWFHAVCYGSAFGPSRYLAADVELRTDGMPRRAVTVSVPGVDAVTVTAQGVIGMGVVQPAAFDDAGFWVVYYPTVTATWSKGGKSYTVQTATQVFAYCDAS